MDLPSPQSGTFTINGGGDLTPQELSLLVGSELGVSGWHTLDQREVDLFALATGGHHDRDRPFGVSSDATVAPPSLALSLAPRFIPQVFGFAGFRSGVNYGCRRVRFPSSARVEDRIRGRLSLQAVAPLDTGCRVELEISIEVEDADRPACIAEILLQYFN